MCDEERLAAQHRVIPAQAGILACLQRTAAKHRLVGSESWWLATSQDRLAARRE